VLPQGGFGVQRFMVSVLPAGTLAQLPRLVATLHAWQRLHELVLQQTPSTQKLPVRQSVVAVHGWPSRFWLPQRLVFGSQMAGDTQSRSRVQAARQAVLPLQTYGAHGIIVAGWQTPRPLQVRPLVWVTWLAGHDAGAHDVPAPYRRQAPLPSQNPSVPQLGAPWSEQRDMMSAEPAGMLLHVPRDCVSAHDLQTPVQVVSQQTPCSQKVERHSSLVAHSAPFGLRPQNPPTHAAGGRQSPSTVHDALHAPVPQR
jgi:hypothetical protein